MGTGRGGAALVGVKWETGKLHIESGGRSWTRRRVARREVPTTDRLEWTLKSLGRVKGDRLLLRDDGQPYAVKQMRALIAQDQVEAGLQETGNMHIDTPSAPASQ